MQMYFVHELVKVVFMSRAQVDKCLHSLVRVCRNILLLASINSLLVLVSMKRERMAADILV